MKFRLYIYMPALLATLLFYSCKEGKETGASSFPHLNNPMIDGVSAQIAQDPDNAALYFERGTLLHRIEEDSLALIDYKKAVTLDSSKSHYYSAIGDLLFEHKDITGSIDWLQKAIKLNPKDPKAHLKIAKMFIFIEDYNQAFNSINTVLRQDVYNPEAYVLKGIAYKHIKDTAKALSSFQTAINALPDYTEAIMQIASIYAARKDPMALTYYENAYRSDTTDVSPIYNAGLFHLNNGDIEAAKKQYTRAIMENKNYANAFFGMGFALMQQDSLEKARRQFDIVVGIDPTNTDAYYNRGLCAEMMGNKTEALADYEQTLQFDPEYKPAIEAKKRVGGK